MDWFCWQHQDYLPTRLNVPVYGVNLLGLFFRRKGCVVEHFEREVWISRAEMRFLRNDRVFWIREHGFGALIISRQRISLHRLHPRQLSLRPRATSGQATKCKKTQKQRNAFGNHVHAPRRLQTNQ
jgi:hypothetical protein